MPLSHNGLLDAAFVATQTDNIGFDLKGTPLGKVAFDLYQFGPGYVQANYSDIFDGMIYYKNVADMEMATGIPGIFPPELADEYYRRKALLNNISLDSARKKYAEALREVNQLLRRRHEPTELQAIGNQISNWLETHR
ncbi:hypothetical protein DU508_16860 [Pedobacter chinensis]|uniref:Uncharacterized protein n=1 Tax=Pedobacter chinensis TaxID=2282421 RepID=A0A369PYT2_9SPHI|nr:hypothetical protein [Pedobacter chinensis]RDC55248.1 hypothetical protein DU508_16860 [Pedobacter chinensis]